VPIYLVVIVVFIGLGLLFTSANPNSRLTAKEYLIGLVVGILAIKFCVYIITIICDINFAMVKMFEDIAGANVCDSYLESLINFNTLGLGAVIVAFLAIFSIGILNWQYSMCKVIIALLIGLLPIVIIISIIPSRRSAAEVWIKEFIAQVFLQTSHAAVLTMMLLIIGKSENFWLSLVCVMGMPAIAGVVRRVIGAESFGTGLSAGVGTALGLGALMAVGRMLKPGNKQAPSKDYGLDSGLTETMSKGANYGNPGGSTLGKMAKTGFKTAAVITGGVAGGLVTGAAAGNPAFGIAGGVAAGTIASEGAARVVGGASDLMHKSSEELMDQQGIVDSAQLDNPGEAYKYGKNLFGGGLVGSIAGAGMAAGKQIQAMRGKTDPGLAVKMKNISAQNTQGLVSANQELADYKPIYDSAKARFTQAKNMYKPESTNMQSLSNQASKLSESIGMASNQQEYQSLTNQLQQVNEQIAFGNQEYADAKENLENVETEYARKQMAVSDFEQRLTKAGMKQEFETLRNQQETGGGIDTTWR